MQVVGTRVEFTEPAIGGLRVFLFFCLVALAGCAANGTDRRPRPESADSQAAGLDDRTDATGFRLAILSRQLQAADALDADGMTAAASAMLEVGRGKLPPDHVREHRYLDALQAAVWGRPGEARDAEKAGTYLRAALAAGVDDPRLLGEAKLAEVAVMLGAGHVDAAEVAGLEALAALQGAEAWSRLCDACREIASALFEYDRPQAASLISLRGARVADELQDDPRSLRAWLDAGVYGLKLDRIAGENAFLRAYAAAYRLGRTGWRSVVVATAVQALHDAGHHSSAVVWGDRVREPELGLWPRREGCGLGARAYALLTAQYALSLLAAQPGSPRLRDALNDGRSALENAPETDAATRALADRIRAALLQIETGK